MTYLILDKDGNTVNRVIASEEFVIDYCKKHGHTYKEEIRPDSDSAPDPERTEEDDTAAMLVDHEYRLTLLELGLTE